MNGAPALFLASDQSAALAEALLALGDDELVLGHRDSEWCGVAPILEEDIAFANIALDEIGHAAQWYDLYVEWVGATADVTTDRLVFNRPWQAWCNIQMVELPRGDWAFSMLRQYLFDAGESLRLQALSSSAWTPLAHIAAKMLKEEIYHLRHSQAWVKRLSLGTQESRARMQRALESLLPFTRQMWAPLPGEETLVTAGILSDSQALGSAWENNARAFLQECSLDLPGQPRLEISRDIHTSHLPVLLAEMQSVARLDPEAEW